MKTIITEGETDKRILEKLLDGSEYRILSSSGFSSALSKAQTILSKTLTEDDYGKIVLLLDTNTFNEDEIKNKKEFVEYYINYNKSFEDKFKIVWAKPELEVIFFNNQNLLKKRYADRISDTDIEIGKFNPKNMLKDKLDFKNGLPESFLNDINLNDFKNDKILNEIETF